MSGQGGPELLRTPPASGFAEDYEAGAPVLAPFYAGHPRNGDAFRRKAAEVAARFDDADRRRLPRMLTPVSDEAKRRLDAVAAGDGFVVTTGQQAGILGGPLFTLYKALSAVALAESLEAQLGTTVLPVFWVASEDHDWAEIGELHLLDTGNRLHRFELSDPAVGHEGGTGPSVARRPLDAAAIGAFIDAVRDVLPPTEFRDDLVARARAAYAPGGSTSAGIAFESLVGGLLRSTPLCLVQASDPELKQASIAILRAELERGVEHEAVLRQQTDEFEAAGYESQVPILEGAANVFYESEAGRERLVRDGDGWTTRGRGLHLSRADAMAQLEARPERFSPNVLLRPVVESAVLPTLAYVGGPAEVRYFAQTGCLFRSHGVGMPLVVPRASLMVVEAKTRKVLDKFDLEPGDLAQPEHELATRIAAAEIPDAVAAALKRARAAVGESYGALGEAVKSVDPTLSPPVGSARTEAFNALEDLEKRVTRALKSRNEVALEQIAKARANLYPNGKPQERVLNALQYLARYGDDFVDATRRAITYELDDSTGAGWTGVECA